MSDLPSAVFIREVGPREGFQFEKNPLPTDEKVRLIDALSETGVREIEVTSFVRPEVVPQMADADELVQQFRRRPGVSYTAVSLNLKGYQRAQASGKLDITAQLGLSASEAFSKRNSNRTLEQSIQDLPERIKMFRALGINAVGLSIATAFGCNFEGDVPQERVLDLLGRLFAIAREHDLGVTGIRLNDTMGWANPLQIKRMIAGLHERWTGTPIGLHLHDTRGLGLSNAFAAMEMGVADFDTAVGGLGGCPFAGHRGAAGNIATEDFLLLCQEVGVETGVDLNAMIGCAQLAEEIVGHPLPGKVKTGGNLCGYRQRAQGS